MHKSSWFGIAMVTLTLVLFGLVAIYPAISNSASAAQEPQKDQLAVAQAQPTPLPAGHAEHHAAGAAMPEAEPTAMTEAVSDTMSAAEHAAHHAVEASAVTATTPSTVTGMTEGEMAGMNATISTTQETNTMSAMPGHERADTGSHDMGPVSSAGVPLATETAGGQPLAYREEAGVKVFELTAKPVLWPIMQGVTVTAWTYNGVLPGPMIRVTEGDRVRVIVKNELPEATSVHWHGLLVPNAMDGAVPVTQPAIEPGEVFTYEFEAKPAGSFMYHSHVDTDKQIPLGLYGPLIVDSVEPELAAADVDVSMMLSEWRVVEGETYPAMPLVGMEPNYFTINGKAFPDSEAITVKKGTRVRIRLMGIGQFVHPMHLHGLPFQVVATDGYPVPAAARLTKDTISIAPGERYDIEFVADAPGTWMLHCHIPHHITNDGAEPGGLVALINVVE